MGFLDDLLGGAMGGAAGQPEPDRRQLGSGGGMSQVMMALLPVVLQMLASRGGRQGGGGLGDILGQVLGRGQPGGGGLGDVLGGLTGRGAGAGPDAGGLGDLLERMQRTGYGDQARSWVGTGQNAPIQPDALDQIFGQGGVEEIARRAGVTREQAAEGMSELLPEVVNHVTPDGEVPGLDQLTDSVEGLRRRMGL
jgi:uncharacterized protein YidB (DUF937 family)